MLGSALKKLREEKGISQQKLAEIVGLTQQAIAKWEAGKTEPSLHLLTEVAKCFDVTIDHLIGCQPVCVGFGRQLKKIRSERGLSQEDIGAIVHMGKSTVSQWENEIHLPGIDVIIKIANYLDVSLDYLLGRTESLAHTCLGGTLKKLREEKGLTQEELADLIKLSRQTVGHYEAGRAKPDIDTLVKLANYFNVTTDHILGRAEHIAEYKPSNRDKIAQTIKDLGPDVTRQLCCLRKLTDEEKVSLKIFLEGLHARRQQKNH